MYEDDSLIFHNISDSPYKFRLSYSGCTLHSPAELKFIRGGR